MEGDEGGAPGPGRGLTKCLENVLGWPGESYPPLAAEDLDAGGES